MIRNVIQKVKWVIALAFVATLVPTVAKADITYAVDETVGIGSVTGFITTNGTTGALVTADIVDWNLVLNDGTNPTFDLEGPLSGNNSLAFLDGDLSATSTELLFNFGAADGGRFQLYISGGPIICYSTIVDCTGTPVGVSLDAVTPDNHFVYTALSDTEVIASVVTAPEPSSLGFLACALAGLAVIARKRIGGNATASTT